MKKITLLILSLASLIVLGLGIYLWINKSKVDPLAEPEPQLSNNDYFVQSIEHIKKSKKPLDSNNLAFSESLHEGSAIFVGPYRLELAIEKKEQQALFALFIDNTLAQPIYPKGTEVIVLNGNEKIRLHALRSGLMANTGAFPDLNKKIQVYGTINGKNFNIILKVNKYRNKPVDLRGISP